MIAGMAVVLALAAPAAASPLVLEPPGPPASRYRTDGPLTPGQRVIARALANAGLALRLDPGLSRAAQAYARALPAEGGVDLPMAAVEYLLHRSGCPDATAAATVLYTTEEALSELTERLEVLLQRPDLAGTTDVGIARVAASVPPYRWRWGIVLVRRRFTMESFPARLEQGQQAVLQLRLDDGLSHAKVVLLHPGGRIEERGAGRSGRLLTVALDAGEKRGPLWVEVVADGQHGPEIVALFPVWIGMAPPGTWEGSAVVPEDEITDAAAAERLLASLVQQDRHEHGLPPLARDPALDAIARDHCRDMAAAGYFGHRSPRFGDLSRRMAKGGYRSLETRENVARAATIREAEEALMRSPGHRANILAPEVTHLGVGAVRDPEGEGWLVTQLFACPAPDLDAAGWRQAILRRFLRARDETGAPPLRRWPGLDEAARGAARRLVAGERDTGALVHAAMEALRERGDPPAHLELRAGFAWQPDDVPWTPEDAGRPDAIGVGVVVPESAMQPVAVAVLLASGRPAG